MDRPYQEKSRETSNSRLSHRSRISLPAILILCSLLIILVWFFFSTSDNIRFDSDQMIYSRDARLSQYRNEGRVILAFALQAFFPEEWNPALYGIVFLFCFIGAGLVMTVLLFRFTEKKWPVLLYGLFYLLYGTSPVWAFQVYFTVQAPVVAMGMLLAASAAGADVSVHTKKVIAPFVRILSELFLSVFCAALMLIYQSLIIYYLAVVSILLICRLLRGKTVYWKILAVWAARMMISLLLYIWIARTARGGTESNYLMDQIQWRKLPFTACLKNIVVEFGKIILFFHSGHFSMYPIGLALFAVLLVRILRRHEYGRNESILLVLCALSLLLLPMAISIMEGSRPVPRTQFALQVIGAFLPVCFIGEANRHRQFLTFLAVAFLLIQSALVFRLTETDNRRNKQDMAIAARIVEDLRSENTGNLPVVFYGSLEFPDDTVLLEKTDVIGLSFFEWSYNPDRPGSASDGIVRFLNAASGGSYIKQRAVKEDFQIVTGMPVCPADGYIHLTRNHCIVKLSED